jgi:tetratricopeptide (TPR) repeat protein
MKLATRVSGLVLVGTLATQAAFAEGRVSGTVKDASGAAVADVVVRLEPSKVGERGLEAKTNKKGQYLFALVRAGQYTLLATHEGMRVSAIDVRQRDDERRVKFQKAEPVAAGGTLPTLDIAGTDVIVYDLVLVTDTAGAGSSGTGVPLLGSGQIVELLKAGELDKAHAEIDRTLAEDPQNAAMLYLRAYAEMQAGDVDRALASADALLQASPGFAGAHLLRGNLLEKKGNPDAALTEYRAEAHGSADATVQRDAWVRIAILSKTQGRPEDTLEALRKIIELDPGNVVAHSQLVDHYTQAGDVDALTALLETAPDEVRNDPMVHFNLGASLYNQDKFDAAAQEFQKVIEQKPDLADAYKHLGFCKVSLGDFPGAITAVKKYLELAPGAPDAAQMQQLIDGLEKRAAAK